MTPDSKVVYNGVTVKKKIIPDTMRWIDNNKAIAAGFSAGAYYKARVKMPKVNTVTVHNTEDLDNIEDDAERYVLATYNQNMGAVRPHFYIDDKSVWQILDLNEVAWCNARGTYKTGAIDDISIECVMNEDPTSDRIAEDNAARIAAYCLYINNLDISALRSHTYWINTNLGITGSVDYMNTYKHPRATKYCPYYILPHWSIFKATVKKYLDALKKPTESTPINTTEKFSEKSGKKRVCEGFTSYELKGIYKSKGQAAIRNAMSQDSDILERCVEGNYYPMDRYIEMNSGTTWYRHSGGNKHYSMKQDGFLLFEQAGTYQKYKVTANLNIRVAPTLSAPICGVCKSNDVIYAFSTSPSKADGYYWKKIIYKGKIAYCVTNYIKEL